jgi:hypothetical protein
VNARDMAAAMAGTNSRFGANQCDVADALRRLAADLETGKAFLLSVKTGQEATKDNWLSETVTVCWSPGGAA